MLDRSALLAIVKNMTRDTNLTNLISNIQIVTHLIMKSINMTRDTNLTILIINIQIVIHLAIEHFNLASIMSVSTNSSREHQFEDKTDFMEVRSPSDTYHIMYKHDTSKVSITLLTKMLPPSLTLLVVKCVIPFMLLIQQREIKLCLSVCLSVCLSIGVLRTRGLWSRFALHVLNK